MGKNSKASRGHIHLQGECGLMEKGCFTLLPCIPIRGECVQLQLLTFETHAGATGKSSSRGFRQAHCQAQRPQAHCQKDIIASKGSRYLREAYNHSFQNLRVLDREAHPGKLNFPLTPVISTKFHNTGVYEVIKIWHMVRIF